MGRLGAHDRRFPNNQLKEITNAMAMPLRESELDEIPNKELKIVIMNVFRKIKEGINS